MEVECIEGYTLVGESTLTCGQKFDYTARRLPECVPIAGCEIPLIGVDREPYILVYPFQKQQSSLT